MKRTRTLADLGEDQVVTELIQRLRADPKIIAGPGDDCAVVPSGDRRFLHLLKTDAVVEGVHFSSGTPPAGIGWKAACRAVSDVAAMGGWPVHAMITLVVSPGCRLAWVKSLYTGFDRAARRYQFSIVGGETCRLPPGAPIVISVSLLGCVEKNCCILRSGARRGDAIFVTGQLGGSRRGWHLNFQPRVVEGRWLASKHHPTAMMDLSDGLAKDLPRLAKASGVGFTLDLTTLPRRRGCTTEQALGDGEDYELLFTVPHKQADPLLRAWKKKFPHLRLTRIGSIIAKSERSTPFPNVTGWEHFSQ
ncbi:MAG: thiamine-phosphate kinase [Verrucomicrobiales bacterium]